MAINDGQQKLLRVVEALKQEESVDQSNGQLRMFAKQPQIEQMFDFFNEKIGTVQQENRELREEVKSTNQQMTRVGNSLSKLVAKMEEQVVTNVNPDFMVSPHEPGREDVALVYSPLASEAVYRCTTADLAAYIGIHASRLGLFLTNAGVKGDTRFHHEVKTGSKSKVHLYKPRALKALYEFVVESKPNWIKRKEVDALEKYLQAHELL